MSKSPYSQYAPTIPQAEPLERPPAVEVPLKYVILNILVKSFWTRKPLYLAFILVKKPYSLTDRGGQTTDQSGVARFYVKPGITYEVLVFKPRLKKKAQKRIAIPVGATGEFNLTIHLF